MQRAAKTRRDEITANSREQPARGGGEPEVKERLVNARN